MYFDFIEKAKVKFNTDVYVESIINEFPMKISKCYTDLTPSGNNIFRKSNSIILGKNETEEFYTSVSRGMIVDKIDIPGIHQTVAFLSTKVKESNDTGWQKLARMIKYFNGTKKNYLTLSADDLKFVKCYVEASFAFHPGLKSHSVAILTVIQGEM